MNARTLAKALAPPVVLNLYHRLSRRRLRFAGCPADWQKAKRMSGGYDGIGILEHVKRATRAVVSGEALYERDGVLFNDPNPPFAVLSALLRVAAASAGRLDVVDFGGSLGSTYRQCRPLLQGLAQLRWCVVEQPSFVEAGKAEFATEELHFARSLAEVPASQVPRVIVASSVLQYLEDPRATLSAFAGARADHLVIDRTPVGPNASDRLCIQHVPRHIYPASYPCWILSRTGLIDELSRHWRLLCEYPCAEGTARTDDGFAFEFRGFILERTG